MAGLTVATTRRTRITHGAREVTAEHRSDGGVVVDGTAFIVTALDDGRYLVRHENTTILVAVHGPPQACWATTNGRTARFVVDSGPGRRSTTAAIPGDMSAPMPATVAKVLVGIGDRVTNGTPLVVLEAMKMELPIRASRDGVVRALACRVGQLVTPGTPLVELEP